MTPKPDQEAVAAGRAAHAGQPAPEAEPTPDEGAAPEATAAKADAAAACAAAHTAGKRTVAVSEPDEPEPEQDTELLSYQDAAVEAEVIEGGAGEADRLSVVSAQAREYLALAQRTRADFENYKKRAVRDAAQAQERGVARLARELLPAIDHLELALQAAETAQPAALLDGQGKGEVDSKLAAGIKLVHADVLAALSRVGIEPFSPEGEPFDPQYHEAMAQMPSEGATPGAVVEVLQPGYRIGDTVLRPARVVVAA